MNAKHTLVVRCAIYIKLLIIAKVIPDRLY
jgi:hypothetical protein